MTQFNLKKIYAPHAYLEPETLAGLKRALDGNDFNKAARLMILLKKPDKADVFDALSPQKKQALLKAMAPAAAADILERLPDEEMAEVLLGMPRTAVLDILNEMEPDEAADLIDEMPGPVAEAILPRLDEKDVRELINYPEHTAGAIMTTVPLTVDRDMTAAEALAALRDWEADRDDLHCLFVTDEDGRLQGVVGLFQLLRAPRDRRLGEFMDTRVIHAAPDADDEACAELFRRYGQITLPVVDDGGKILGVVAYDDLVDVIDREADEDMHRMGAVEPLKTRYLKTGVPSMVRKRAVWLLLLFGAAILTTTIMAAYEDQLEAVAVLAVFIPLIIGAGGNSGAQTTTTVIRAQATGEIHFSDAFRVWFKEIRIGLLLGASMAVPALLLALVMFQDARLAATVGVSIFFIILTANFVGAILPLLAKRLSLDPTLLSAPMISTTVDALGLVVYFSVARLIFGI